MLGKRKKLAFWGWTGFVAWKLTANSDQQLPFSIMYWSILSITITETHTQSSGFPFNFFAFNVKMSFLYLSKFVSNF